MVTTCSACSTKILFDLSRVFLEYDKIKVPRSLLIVMLGRQSSIALLTGCHITCNFLKTATFLKRPHMSVPNLQVVVVKFLTLYKLSEGSLLLLILTYSKAKERTWILLHCCRLKISNAYVPMRSATRLKNVMLETEGQESNFGRQTR